MLIFRNRQNQPEQMKKLAYILLVAFIAACNSDAGEDNLYTGESVTYSLYSGSDVGTAGQVQFKERTDGAVDVIVTLDAYSGSEIYPVHLHYGDLSDPDAPQATLLDNFRGSTGKSQTTIRTLADESLFTFDRVKDFNGSVKIHLGDTGPEYDIIISAGNIGSNESKGFNLESIARCGEDIQL